MIADIMLVYIEFEYDHFVACIDEQSGTKQPLSAAWILFIKT